MNNYVILALVLYVLGFVMSSLFIATAIVGKQINPPKNKSVLFIASLLWFLIALWVLPDCIRFYTTKGNMK